MKRGDVVTAAGRGEFTGKPRPYVVVQSSATLARSVAITLCPLTSRLTGADLFRIAVTPNPANGLSVTSEIEIDHVTTIRKAGIGERIGEISPDTMERIDHALRRWLSL